MPIPSPCIGLCKIDESSKLCIGCARTIEEVAIWSKAPPATLEKIWAELPHRRKELGIGPHRLNRTPDHILSFVSATLKEAAGAWVFGIYGAVAEFCIGEGELVDLELRGEQITAVTPRAAIQFNITNRVQMLAVDTVVGSASQQVIVLAVPRASARMERHNALTNLGRDEESIRQTSSEDQIYDLGLGMDAAGYCIRTTDLELIRLLNNRIGYGWSDLLKSMGREIVQSSPTRVVKTPIGRLEVFVPIPAPSGRSPNGPHTHFLPPQLSMRLEMPPGFELPDSIVSCGIFYPDLNFGMTDY